MSKELTPDEVEAIKQEAAEAFPYLGNPDDNKYIFIHNVAESDKRIGYQCALEKERQRAKVLVESAQKVVDEYYSSNGAGMFANDIQELEKALTSYNNE